VKAQDAPMAGPLTITRLTGSVGARVVGANLCDDIPDAVARQIRDAFAEHYVLVFPNDDPVGPEEQTRLAALFGEPQPLAPFQFLGALSSSITFDPGSKIADTKDKSAPIATSVRDDRMARELQGLGISGDYDGWHTDSSFTPWLPARRRAAVRGPSAGGR
jgi:alpha-ketoglutarate-dependent taurine dioxygenase